MLIWCFLNARLVVHTIVGIVQCPVAEDTHIYTILHERVKHDLAGKMHSDLYPLVVK
jgi:hypothetical protein